MLTRRLFVSTLGLLTFIWVAGVPLCYVLTLGLPRSSVLSWLFIGTDTTNGKSYILLLVQCLVAPLGLSLGLRLHWYQIQSRVWRGFIVGLAYGTWASTTLLVVPYLGIYPNIPTAAIALTVVGGPSGSATFYLAIIIANLLIYPCIGAFVVYMRKIPHPPGACKKCGYNLEGNVSGVCPECGTPI